MESSGSATAASLVAVLFGAGGGFCGGSRRPDEVAKHPSVLRLARSADPEYPCP
jgi:hypothetical protein